MAILTGEFEAKEIGFAALGADGGVDSRERAHGFLPCFDLTGCVRDPWGDNGCAVLGRDEGTGLFEFCMGVGWRHQSKVSDFDETGRKNVEEKPADELLCLDGDKSLLTGVVVVPGPEGEIVAMKAYQPVIGDGHSVGVATDVAEGLVRSPERPLAVDDPFLTPELS